MSTLLFILLYCLQLILKQTSRANFDTIDMCMQNKVYASPDLSKLKTCDYEPKVQWENNLSLK